MMDASVTTSGMVIPSSFERSLMFAGQASLKRFTILAMISSEVMWGARK